MFNLESSIAAWRQQMLAAGIEAPVPLDELENHLREDIEQQIREGVTAQKAFDLAMIRIGAADHLKREFKKNGISPATSRKLAASFCSLFMLIYAFFAGAALIKRDETTTERVLGFTALAITVGLVALAWQAAQNYFPLVIKPRHQSLIGVIGGVSGMAWFFIFFFLILPRYDFTVNQLAVALLWAMIPVQVLPTVAFLILDKSENQAVTNKPGSLNGEVTFFNARAKKRR